MQGPISAGVWHLVGDGELLSRPVDVSFDIIWSRPVLTDGGLVKVETVLATVTHTFPMGNVVKFEADVTGIAAPASPGDTLIYRFRTVGGGSLATFTPNGDALTNGGRFLSLKLPE